MFQFETIPGRKKARGFFITISNLPKNSFHFGSHFPLAFLPERIIKKTKILGKNEGVAS